MARKAKNPPVEVKEKEADESELDEGTKSMNND